MPSTRSNQTPRPSYSFAAIGTHWQIETTAPLSAPLRAAIQRRIAEFDRAYSRFRDDSIVAMMAKKAGEYSFPPDAAPLMTFYRQLYDATDGRVTPLVGQALADSGYDKDYSLRPRPAAVVPAWDDVMQWQGSRVVTTKPVMLDVGAAGKGYLVDILGEILERQGIDDYVIDASGDIRHRGRDVQRIGLENPYDPTRVIGVMNLQNGSLCGSAANRRRWGKGMHHIFDPFSGSPTRAVAATWAAAASTMMADGLATALFFVNGPALRRSFGDIQFVRLNADGKLSHSHDFVGELFI